MWVWSQGLQPYSTQPYSKERHTICVALCLGEICTYWICYSVLLGKVPPLSLFMNHTKLGGFPREHVRQYGSVCEWIGLCGCKAMALHHISSHSTVSSAEVAQPSGDHCGVRPSVTHSCPSWTPCGKFFTIVTPTDTPVSQDLSHLGLGGPQYAPGCHN